MRLISQIAAVFLAFNFVLAVSGPGAFVSAQTEQDGAQTEPDINALRQKGFALLRAGSWPEAHTIFEEVIAHDKRDYLALYGNGLALFNLRRITDADDSVSDAIELLEETGANDPLLADSLVLSALISAGLQKPGDAIKKLKRAIELVPGHFDANFSIGRAYFGNGDLINAVKSFENAVEIQPGNPQARFFLATALEQAGSFDAALGQYRALLKLDENNPQGNLGLGVLLIKLEGDKSSEGVDALRRAISTNGDLYEARITLGKTLIRTNRAAEAVDHLIRAAELAPKNPEPHYQLALAYRKLGKKDDAAAEMEIVRKIHEERRGVPE